MFRRGNLGRFLLAAAALVLNGAIIVCLFERHAPGSNIHTLGESLWWSVVTVTTVGYGDFFPVTFWGRITAGFVMGTGVLTLAVVTAQVASSFVAQAPSRARHSPHPEPDTPQVTLAARPAAGPDRRAAHRRHVAIRASGWSATAGVRHRPALINRPWPASGPRQASRVVLALQGFLTVWPLAHPVRVT